jgi:hypothetical protein
MASADRISEINKSFLFFLIFTLVTSYFAYHIIDKGYDDVFATYASADLPQ